MIAIMVARKIPTEAIRERRNWEPSSQLNLQMLSLRIVALSVIFNSYMDVKGEDGHEKCENRCEQMPTVLTA